LKRKKIPKKAQETMYDIEHDELLAEMASQI
jgi:hypothetical protein